MNYSEADKDKLKRIISEGITVNQEVDTLKEGLRDTIKAVAEEMGIKPAVLNKAIRIAYKAEQGKTREEFEELEAILEAVGRS
jgi:transposase-like protein|tara:strand:- start:21142 stop:21390 length:249 start_codon:yes stop_codon:yes gene_type:complete